MVLLLIWPTVYLAYRPALKGGIVWDDDENLTRPELQSLSGLYRIWFDPSATAQYYPLVHTAFWIEHKLWGDSVAGYHLITLFWHMLSIMLIYLILHKLKIPGALLAAAIFALHPVMVESVAWITEQKNTLSTAFYLGAMLAFFQFRESHRRAAYFCALGLFVLALMTKTVTVSLPFAILVVLWWQRGTLSRGDVLPVLPFFALGFAGGLTTIWVERNVVGALGSSFELTFVARILLAGRAILFYLGKLLWPTNLIFVYPRWVIDPAQWWQWIYPILTLALTVMLWLVRHRTRAPLAAWLFFCSTLFPVLGFFNVYYFIYSFVADHFQYLASLGIIVLAAAGIASGLNRLPQTTRRNGVVICTLGIGVLAALSSQQCLMYADAMTLLQTTISRNRDCWMAYDNIGSILSFKQSPDAIGYIQTGLRLNPNNPIGHNNLGYELAKRGQYKEAIEEYHVAIRQAPDNFDAHKNLGYALLKTGNLPEALDEMQAAVRIRPDEPRALTGLGSVYLEMKRYPEATEQFRHALQLNPEFTPARTSLGSALARIGNVPEAIEQFRMALQTDANYALAYYHLGLLMAEQGKFDVAIKHLEKALQLRFDQPDLRLNLGDSYRQTGQPRLAIENYQAAIRLNPQYLPAYVNLAQTLATINQSNQAIDVAEKAIDVARATRQDMAAKKIEDWLKRYRTEAQPAANSNSSSP